MKFERSSGILLHPTSFPGRFGIGEIGQEAYKFIDFLVEAEQRLWQLLPLVPPGYGDSPYQSFSAFAGNPLLIGLDDLVDKELLTASDLDDPPKFPKDKVDFSGVMQFKMPLLQKAFDRFQAEPSHPLRVDCKTFCDQNAWWLDDYALFAAIYEAQGGKEWTQWEKGLAFRDPDALAQWSGNHELEIETRKFWQFLFFKQWWALKTYCWENGVKVIGDIPIYVSHDSADVWAHPEMYLLDEKGKSTVVAGVPPDYFSKTGQLWGNPIYNWELMQQTGYKWWIDRFRQTLTQVDIVRLDHFRGFEAYWEVPASEKTAIDGRWVKGPGSALFDTLQYALGELPIIAENLGLITKEVESLRERFHFPGMAVMQFAFGGDATSIALPHNFTQNLAVYTGTHDNDTTVSWWKGSKKVSTLSSKQIDKEKNYARNYLNTDGEEIHWTCIRALMASVADTAIFPLQDILGLGSRARMNTPGRPSGNWQWRYSAASLKKTTAKRLKELTEIYGRLPITEEENDLES